MFGEKEIWKSPESMLAKVIYMEKFIHRRNKWIMYDIK